MSHQERDNFISLFTTLLISIPYFVYVFWRYPQESFVRGTTDEFVFWASAILLIIPIRIVGEIIFHILITIISAIVTGKEESEITDERDRLIDLKGTRNSSYAFMAGIFLAMLAMATTKSPAAMFSVLIFAGFVSELVGIASQIYYYRRGF